MHLTFDRFRNDHETIRSTGDAFEGGIVPGRIIERAFQLAPQCSGIKELRKALAKEEYAQFDAHLDGLGIQRQLRKLYNNGAGTKKRGPKAR